MFDRQDADVPVAVRSRSRRTHHALHHSIDIIVVDNDLYFHFEGRIERLKVPHPGGRPMALRGVVAGLGN